MDLTHLTDAQLRRLCDRALVTSEPAAFMQIARAMDNARNAGTGPERSRQARRAGINRALDLGVLRPEDIPTAA